MTAGVIRFCQKHHAHRSAQVTAEEIQGRIGYECIGRMMTLNEISNLPCVAAHKLIRGKPSAVAV